MISEVWHGWAQKAWYILEQLHAAYAPSTDLLVGILADLSCFTLVQRIESNRELRIEGG